IAMNRDMPGDADRSGSLANDETDADDLQGWEAIAEWTGAVDPNTVDELREMRALEPLYPLLHALVGRSLRDFLVRAAAIRAIVASGRANLPPEDLNQVLWWLDIRARDALLPAFTSTPLLTTEVLAAAAEQQVLRERKEAKPVAWDEAPEAPRASDTDLIPAEILALLADLMEIAEASTPTPLAEVVPRGSASESFLRASLLPLVGDRRAG